MARNITGRPGASAQRNQPPLPGMLVRATASQPRLDYAGQDEQDGRQGQADAHSDGLSKLVRLELWPLCRAGHVAGVHPSLGRVEHF